MDDLNFSDDSGNYFFILHFAETRSALQNQSRRKQRDDIASSSNRTGEATSLQGLEGDTFSKIQEYDNNNMFKTSAAPLQETASMKVLASSHGGLHVV